MEGDIRKVSIGVDYKNSMHYIVGQNVLDGRNIHAITRDKSRDYFIWTEKDGEVILWKELNHNLPIIVEYNINF